MIQKNKLLEKDEPSISEKSVIYNQNNLDAPTGNLESESIAIDPILLDITNQNITQHEILQKMARQDLQSYTNKMANQMNKSKKRVKEYQVGDLVRVAVLKIDRFGIDHPTLPCKIMERTENDKYRIGSKFGMIEIYYTAGKLEPIGTASFPELSDKWNIS